MALAAAAVVAPGGPVARASSARTPTSTVADRNTIIAVQTSGNRLRFYWNEHGTDTWHGEQVAPDGTTFSSPSIGQVGDFVVIAAQGAGGSLDFYWAANGTPTWIREVVAGPGGIDSAPAITANSPTSCTTATPKARGASGSSSPPPGGLASPLTGSRT